MPPPSRKMISSANLCAITARRRIARRIGVLLAQNLRRTGILHVIQPALDGNFPAGDAQVTKGEHGGIRRRRIPRQVIHFGRLAGDLQRVKTFRNQFDHAGYVEIVPESVVKSLEQCGVLRVGGRRLEVRDGQANFSTPRPVPVLTQSCAGRAVQTMQIVTTNQRQGRARTAQRGAWSAAFSAISACRNRSVAFVHPCGDERCGVRQYRIPIGIALQDAFHRSHSSI